MKRNESKEFPKENILRAAKKEFSERGFSGARMSSIAKRASVNKALIHYYFQDKETLYVEVLKKIFQGSEVSTSVPEYLGKWNLTPSQKLYVIIYFVVNIFLKATDPDAMRIIHWEIAEGKRYLESLILEYNMPRQKILNDVVREGIENGEFETDFPRMAAMNISSFILLYSINKKFYEGKPIFREMYGKADDKDVLEFVLENIFKSLRPKNRKLEIPVLPEDLKALLEDMLKILIEKKDEGINDEVFRRVGSILQH